MIKLLVLSLIAMNIQAKNLKIAHAGGGINQQNYSNSLEAMEHNYAKGFRYFEIDFSWTSDDKLVCLHDWDKRFKKVFGFQTKQPLSFAEFNHLLSKTEGLHPCTLNSLAEWISHHKDVKIITDVKHQNLKAIQLILDMFPEIQPQLIPQFYQPYEYNELKHMGFNDLIWILYQYEGSESSIVDHCQDMNLFAVSMRASQARKKFAKQLRKNGQKIFVYTINNPNKYENLINKLGVSAIYTDFLDP